MFSGARLISSSFSRVNIKQCGYRLSPNIIYLSEERLLINYGKESMIRIQLRQTMGNLLLYLLNNAAKDFISDDELMEKVWEENDLRASTHRLWQVTRDLRYKLDEAGLDNTLFTRADRKGFVVNLKSIMPIFHSTAVTY